MRSLAGLVVILAVAFAAFYAWAYNSEIAPVSPAVSAFDPGIVAKGAQLAAIGNCAVCHTQSGGKPFAGGFPIETPFGTVYGSNITPDIETGIGNWSQAAFVRAMRTGVDRKGNHLYPAFPYDHFTKTTDNDLAALYAFMMTREPVRQENRPPDLIGPLNWRLFAAGWKLLFLRQGEYQTDSAQSAVWNRGAYLVEGLGHCGACHTPRNVFGAEKRGEQFDGGEGEGWHGPALGEASNAPVPWTAEQLYAYLRTGFSDQHGFAAGPMQPVVHSLSKAPDGDVRAMAIYIASLAQKSDAAQREERTRAALSFAQTREAKVGVAPAATTGVRTDGRSDGNGNPPSGAAIFAGACASCHHAGGDLPVSRPVPLALSSAVNAPDATNLLHVVLSGIHPSPGTRGPLMPDFAGALTDAQIVALASYVRSQFSGGPAWSDIAATLAKIRPKSQQRTETP